MQCKKCGTEVSGSFKFCPNCGEKVSYTIEERVYILEEQIGKLMQSKHSELFKTNKPVEKDVKTYKKRPKKELKELLHEVAVRTLKGEGSMSKIFMKLNGGRCICGDYSKRIRKEMKKLQRKIRQVNPNDGRSKRLKLVQIEFRKNLAAGMKRTEALRKAHEAVPKKGG